MLNTTTHETPAVFISGDKDGRRIEFAADAAASAALARLMAQNRSIRLPLPADPDAALPRPFAFLQLICADASGGLLSVGISDSGDTICLTGDAAYAKLIAALEYFFDSGAQAGDHFHLDAAARDSLLHSAAPALIFVCL
ncbi:hypothetical protein HMPREF9120_01594 [Neisseria sp. oral taxon 020 str. F0370]|uniref:hypothetical protein n=1 Tax=unclassified Neisseria TaxID=2623750 RepID=UPI0002A3B585|nr:MULTISPECIES: hypothetical protein [unclassified Neisseria]ASP16441.1 hypothetical protein CGZ77_01030 [Neisseria sp. KEM232]EKY06104.1 hypothetical protein HMPREF9120_01594 [Neisseria sp. oral taxon 020 str. F0370]